MPDRLLIIVLLGLVSLACWVGLSFCFRRMTDAIPTERRTVVLVLWIALFALMPFPLVWYRRFLGESDVTYWTAASSLALVYSAALSGWLWSVLRDRRRRRGSEQ